MNEIRILALPHKEILEVRGEEELITLGEYVIPHACSWVFSNLRQPFRDAVSNHEFLVHPSQRYSPFMHSLKVMHLDPSLEIDKEWQDFVKEEQEELEELAVLNAMLQVMKGWADPIHFTTLKGSSTPLSVLAFIKLRNLLSGKTSDSQVFDILRKIYLLSFSTFSKNDKNTIVPIDPVAPTTVILKTTRKLEEKNPKEINSNIFKTLFLQLLEEEGWGVVESICMQTILSLFWASILNQQIGELSKIALRNFIETSFLVPINAKFLVDANSFIVQRVSVTEFISTVELESNFKPSSEYFVNQLGVFVYQLTKTMKKLAEHRNMEPLGEERFVLRELPNIASTYIYRLVEDSKSENPKFFPQGVWKTLMNTPCFITRERVGELINNYDQRLFANTMRELIVDALYYPEDCVKIVEKRAEENYDKLGDLADMLFSRTP